MAGGKKYRSLKGTKQTFNRHDEDKVKRTTAVKTSAVEGCQSKQSLGDVQQRKYSRRRLVTQTNTILQRGKTKGQKA